MSFNSKVQKVVLEMGQGKKLQDITNQIVKGIEGELMRKHEKDVKQLVKAYLDKNLPFLVKEELLKRGLSNEISNKVS